MKAPPIGKRAGHGRDFRRREDGTILALMRVKERGSGQYILEWRDADKVWWWLGHPSRSYEQALRTLERYAAVSAEIFAVWSSGKCRSDPPASDLQI
jgi:hypothetical protein